MWCRRFCAGCGKLSGAGGALKRVSIGGILGCLWGKADGGEGMASVADGGVVGV